jgi:hypothetical protein
MVIILKFPQIKLNRSPCSAGWGENLWLVMSSDRARVNIGHASMSLMVTRRLLSWSFPDLNILLLSVARVWTLSAFNPRRSLGLPNHIESGLPPLVFHTLRFNEHHSFEILLLLGLLYHWIWLSVHSVRLLQIGCLLQLPSLRKPGGRYVAWLGIEKGGLVRIWFFPNFSLLNAGYGVVGFISHVHLYVGLNLLGLLSYGVLLSRRIMIWRIGVIVKCHFFVLLYHLGWYGLCGHGLLVNHICRLLRALLQEIPNVCDCFVLGARSRKAESLRPTSLRISGELSLRPYGGVAAICDRANEGVALTLGSNGTSWHWITFLILTSRGLVSRLWHWL